MPPQNQDGFVPLTNADGFTPIGDGFVPLEPTGPDTKPDLNLLNTTGIAPYRFQGVDYELVKKGNGIFTRKKGETEQQVIARQASGPGRSIYKQQAQPGDSPVKFWDQVRQRISTDVANAPYIPGFAKPAVAGITDFTWTYIPGMLTDIAANPQAEDILAPSVVSPSRLARTFTTEPARAGMRINLAQPRIPTIRRPADWSVAKTYPAMQAANQAEKTLLAQALRESDNPEAYLSELRKAQEGPVTGFAKYAETDEAIQADLAAQQARADERFRRFMEPSLPGGERHLPQANIGMDIRQGGIVRDLEGDVPSSSPIEIPPTEPPFDEMGRPNWQANLAPTRLWPRTAQTSAEALTPDRMKTAPFIRETEGAPVTRSLPKPKPIATGWGDQPPTGGILEPGGMGIVERRGSRGFSESPYPHERPGIAGDRARMDYFDTLADNIETNVAPVIPQAPKEVEGIIARAREVVVDAAAGLLRAGETQMVRHLGPAGKEIHKVLSKTEFRKRELFNQLVTPYLKAIQSLRAIEYDNFVSTMDGTTIPLNSRVASAVNQARAVTDQIARLAEEAGVRVKTPKGKVVPFKGLPIYWPRRPVRPFPHDRFVEEMMNANPKLSRAEAERLSRNFLNEQEFFNSPQHMRIEGANFEWRKDLSAMVDHIADMSDSIARAEKLGAGDIGNPETLISRLIEQTTDKTKGVELVRSHLRGGMDKNNRFYRAIKRANRAITRSQVYSKLGGFALSIPNQQLLTIMAGDKGEFIKALSKVMTGSQTIKDISREYGTVLASNIPAGILAEAGEKPVPVVGGLIKWADDFSRRVATGTGQGTANVLFESAKTGNALSKKKLGNLLMEDDLTDILKQPNLTDDQLKLATQKFVELTQQLDSNMKLPPAWSNEPLLHVPLIFRRFAFQGTKATWDIIRQDPRAFATFLLVSPLLGELTGDTKALVYGIVRGTVSPDNGIMESIAFEIAGRHRFAEKLTHIDSEDSDLAWLANRLAADYIQSWGFGLLGDFLQGMLGGKNSGYAWLAGPAIDQAVNIFTSAATGDVKELGREAIRSGVPAPIGTGAQHGLIPYKSQEMK